jgi:hypothetical protein
MLLSFVLSELFYRMPLVLVINFFNLIFSFSFLLGGIFLGLGCLIGLVMVSSVDLSRLTYGRRGRFLGREVRVLRMN